MLYYSRYIYNEHVGGVMRKKFLVVLYVILTILGLVLMKLGGNTGTVNIKGSSFDFSMSLISLIGFICYIMSFLIFSNIIVKFDLSYIIPITSGIVQVLTLISGFVIFSESITIKGIIGALMVISGIVIMNVKKNKKYVEDKL